MIRIVIENLLLFLLPTLVYIAYHLLVAKRGGGVAGAISSAPLLWLFAAGAVCVVLFVAYFATFEGGRPGEAYFPPVQGDGGIISSGGLTPPAPPRQPAAPAPGAPSQTTGR